MSRPPLPISSTRPALLQARRGLRLALFLGRALCSAWRLRKESSPARRALWLHHRCRALASLLGLDLRVAGRRPAGSAGIIVANHLGYLDIIALAADAPCAFVAKSEVRGWPVFGFCARAAGTLFIDRSSPADVVRVGAELEALAAAGVWVVVFPEGTSTDGETVLPFRSALLEPAIRNQLPLLAAGLSYSTPSGRSTAREVCWWGDMTLPAHLWNLLGIPWIVAELAYAPAATLTRDRKLAARVLRDQVADLSGASKPPFRAAPLPAST